MSTNGHESQADCTVNAQALRMAQARAELRALPPLADWKRAQITQYIITPEVDVIPAGKPPDGHDRSGVYMLFDEDGAVTYVGQSLGVGYRVLQHLWAYRRGQRQRFVEYGFVDVPPTLLTPIELAHIHALEPRENIAKQLPVWRWHDDAVALIREVWGPKQ